VARFVVVGEALVDLVLRVGEKAPLARPGGSPMNVAVGLARLGHDVELVTRLGDDPYGALVRSFVEDSGVRLAPSATVAGARTSTALARLDAAGAASYEFDIDWTLPDLTLPDDVDAVHVGSLGTWLEPGAQCVRDLVQQARDRGLLVSYDPNARPALVDDREAFARSVAGWAELADVVKASAEDVEFIADGERPPWTSVLDVVTHGADGVQVAMAAGWLAHPGIEVDVVDTIGAGDSFMAGLLDGLAREDLLDRTRLRHAAERVFDTVIPAAAQAAAITCGREGADPPTRSELEAALEAAPAGDS
jgi:fructokinase